MYLGGRGRGESMSEIGNAGRSDNDRAHRHRASNRAARAGDDRRRRRARDAQVYRLLHRPHPQPEHARRLRRRLVKGRITPSAAHYQM
jgi:hypothetical protein